MATNKGTIYIKPSEISQAGFMTPGGPVHSVPESYQMTTSGRGVSTGSGTSNLDYLRMTEGNFGIATNSIVDEYQAEELRRQEELKRQQEAARQKADIDAKLRQQNLINQYAVRQSRTNIQPEWNTSQLRTASKSRYYSKGLSPYEAKKTVEILEEQKKQIYLNRGYSTQQASSLASYDVARGEGELGKEQAQQLVAAYQKQRPVKTAFAVGFQGAGETRSEYESRLGRERYEATTPYSELLIEKRDIAGAVRKGYRDIGTVYFGKVSDIYTDMSKLPRLSPELKESGGKIVGEAFMWGAFSPTMKTGSYGEAFELLTPKKKKQQLSLLNENKFSSLSEMDIMQEKTSIFKGVVEKELLKKKDLKEQLKYLNEIYKTGVRTPEQAAGFKSLFEELSAKDILKFPKIDIGKGGTIITGPRREAMSVYYGNVKNAVGESREMKNLFGITSFTTLPAEDKKIYSKTLKTPKMNLGSLTSVSSLSGQTAITGQTAKSRTKQETMTKQLEVQKSLQPSLNRSSERQLQKMLLRQELKQEGVGLRGVGKKKRGGGGIYIPSFKSLTPKFSNNSFSVSVRRKGRFVPIGSFSSFNRAMEKGVLTTGTTLARSFRITGGPRNARIPFGYYASRKEPGVLIEKGKWSLNTPTEKSELRFFRNLMKVPKGKGKKKNKLSFLS